MAEERDGSLEELIEHLRATRGFDFSGYKRSTLSRRFDKRMKEVGVEGYVDYKDFLETNAKEFEALFDTILINVSSFFRDRDAWEYIAEEVVPAIVAGKRSSEPIRVWSVGVGPGHEAYTLAMILTDALGEDGFKERVKVFATDVDEQDLNLARQGRFPAKAFEEVEDGLRERYFVANGEDFVFRNDLRRCLIFGRNDLLQDAPISKVDLLTCRNTLMYFTADTQREIVHRLHFALAPGGFLFLGKAETLLTHTDLFSSVDVGHRVFSRKAQSTLRDRLLIASEAITDPLAVDQLRTLRISEVAFESGPVAQLVIDVNGVVTAVNGQARGLFGISDRDVGRLLQDLEVSYRPLELRSLIEQAFSDGAPVHVPNVSRRFRGDEQERLLEVVVAPLYDHDGSPIGSSITFEDVTRFTGLREELQRSNEQLESAYEELQSSNEELETTNEELQSSNEELETTNEELQSSNEELETINEELEATNEELETINIELRGRTLELDRVSTFLESVFTSLQAGVLVLGNDLTVQVWNSTAEDMWGLRSEEVVGQPLADLDIGVPTSALHEMAVACLENHGDTARTSLAAVNRRGRSIEVTVTCSRIDSDGDGNLGVILLLDEVQG